MSKRPLIYLASPYSDPDPVVVEGRFDAVCREAALLMGEGVHVYSPIAHTHPIAMRGLLPTDWTFWQEFDRTMLEASTEVYVLTLPGYDTSRGVATECAIASLLQLPVHLYAPRVQQDLPSSAREPARGDRNPDTAVEIGEIG